MTATSTLTLSTFLLARLDEWETLAKGATPGPWVMRRGNVEAYFPNIGHHGAICSPLDNEAAHIAANDPAHVLALVASLRAVIQLHVASESMCKDASCCPEYCADCGGPGGICETLLALARPWADHPDMRPEWKVT